MKMMHVLSARPGLIGQRIAILCSMLCMWPCSTLAERGFAADVSRYSILTRHSDHILPPDLGVTFLFPSFVVDFQHRPGIYVQDATQNLGCTPSVPSVTRYYLSETPDLNLDHAFVLGERRVPALQPGATSEVDQDYFALPAQVPARRYYLIACADARHENAQINTQNHCSDTKQFVQYECDQRTEAQRKNLDDLGDRLFDPKLMEMPSSWLDSPPEQLLSRLGRPLSTETVRRACYGTPESEGRCEYRTWEFAGLSLEAVSFIPASTERADDPPMIQSITISDARYPLVHGLRVGLPRAAFIERLGDPDMNYKTDQPMIYARDPVGYEIYIHLDTAGNVSRITWRRGEGED